MSRSPEECEQLRERIAAIQSWYHAIDLGDGIWTPGPFDMAPYLRFYDLPESMDGLRVLDVGASNGYFAIEFERRGAAEVVALDLPAWIDGDWNPRYRREYMEKSAAERGFIDEHTLGAAFELVVKELGQGRIRKEAMTIYEISPERLGLFDLVFSGSMLMHVRDPILGLQRMRSVCAPEGEVIVSISTMEENPDEPLARFAGGPLECNFWQMSAACLRKILPCCDLEPQGQGRLLDVFARGGEFRDPHFICHAKPI